MTDFSEDWQDLLPNLMTIREERLKAQLEKASQRVQQRIQEASKNRSQEGFPEALREEMLNTPLSVDSMARLVAIGARLFKESWEEVLKETNLSGLIEIILEGQDLTPEELRGFVQALPTSLVHKIVTSAMGTASGTHALFALESHRRNGTLEKDYEILKLDNGRMSIRLPLEGDNVIMIHLDDRYQDIMTTSDDGPR